MEYKVWFNYILFRLGLRKVLPSQIINSVKVLENNEELVEIDDSKIIISTKSPYLRESVNLKIEQIASDLEKDGYKIKILDAYRSYDKQKQSWEKRLKETRLEYPNVSEEELERLTKFKVAKPTKENGGHQTGGAIDITLTTIDGKELDMGTKYGEHNNKTRMNAEGLTEEQLKNRKILLEKMKEYGFVNFPREWWHYCYGDKMWAAYSNKKTCMYGYVEPKVKVRELKK